MFRIDTLILLNGERGVGVKGDPKIPNTENIRGDAFGAPNDARNARVSGRGSAGNAGACGNK
jgi:hypothetical protein